MFLIGDMYPKHKKNSFNNKMTNISIIKWAKYLKKYFTKDT